MSLEAYSGQTHIDGLTSDSRRVRPGYLFAALPGSRHDGCAFIGDALSRGAAAVLAPPGTELPQGADTTQTRPVPLITDENPRRRFALLAARFFGEQPATVAAVTGTNGKTSVVTFLRQIWSSLGLATASMGTLGLQPAALRGAEPAEKGQLTTPDPVELHEILARLARSGVQHLALEASSHGLHQHRLDGVRVTAAAFTNLSRDHLDYHGTMDGYFAAKRRLFTDLVVDGGAAVLNADVAEAEPLARALAERDVRILTYGARGDDVRLESREPQADGQCLRIALGGRVQDVTVPLVGEFQGTNVLCALALAIADGADAEDVIVTLPALQSVRGRMERVVSLASGAAVYVDYAHTPDALTSVLRALRPHAGGRLVVVFGCGGDRDPGKRPEMGQIAADLADTVIVTDDNPRSEDPARIRRQILAACPDAQEIGDRAEAINAALASLTRGDILVVAGKGHETGQIVGDRVLPFDDAQVVRACAGEFAR